MTLTSFYTATFVLVSLITYSASSISWVFVCTVAIRTKFRGRGNFEFATMLFAIWVPVASTDPIGVVASCTRVTPLHVLALSNGGR